MILRIAGSAVLLLLAAVGISIAGSSNPNTVLVSGMLVPSPNLTGTVQLAGTNFLTNNGGYPEFFDGGGRETMLLPSSSDHEMYFLPTIFNNNNKVIFAGGSAPNGSGISITIHQQDGTSGSPTPTQLGEELGFMQAYGTYDTSGDLAIPSSPAAFVFTASENYQSGHYGTCTTLQGVTNGTTTGQHEQWDCDGVVIGPQTVTQGFGVGTLALGQTGTAAGGLYFWNATSGTIQIAPPTGALGSALLTLPDVTDTFAVLDTAQTYGAVPTFSQGIAISGAGAGSNINMSSNILQFAGGTSGLKWLSSNGSSTLMTLSNAGAFSLPLIANAAGNEILCYDTTGGPVTYESAVIGCVPSALRFKDPIEMLGGHTAERLAALRPAVWTYKDKKKWGDRPYVGLYADDVAKMDPRCVDYDKNGKLENYEDRCVIAYLVSTVQQQQREIAALEQHHR